MNHPSIVLVGQSSEVQGMRWQSENRLRIGRFTNDIDVVMNDASVSPHHAEVVATRQGWVVRDLGSMNGTYLNGSAVLRMAGRPARRMRRQSTRRWGRK